MPGIKHLTTPGASFELSRSLQSVPVRSVLRLCVLITYLLPQIARPREDSVYAVKLAEQAESYEGV